MRAFPQCNAPFVQGDLKQWTNFPLYDIDGTLLFAKIYAKAFSMHNKLFPYSAFLGIQLVVNGFPNLIINVLLFYVHFG